MPVNSSVLAGSIAALADLDSTLDLAHTLRQAVNAATRLFGVDRGGGDAGRPRWAAALGGRLRPAGPARRRPPGGVGPGSLPGGVTQGRPVHLRDAGAERAWGEIALLYVDVGLPASLSIPVELPSGPVGTLDLYARAPRHWHDTNVAAVRAYAGLVASLLSLAARAEVPGGAGQPAADRPGAPGRPGGGGGVAAAGRQHQGTPGRRRRPGAARAGRAGAGRTTRARGQSAPGEVAGR
jgi:GAF domain-containing protein